MDEIEYNKDIEGLDEENDQEPFKLWEDKQRELVTSVVDYNLSTLNDLVLGKEINLSPSYQRRFRWDEVRQSKLIESFLMNVPVPPIFLNEDNYGQYSVIDGKQRLMAIHNFLRGKLELEGLTVFEDINGNSFDTLPNRLQTILKTRVTLRAVIILRQSDPLIKIEVFRRLNTGGVKLNPQEIRNSVYPGSLNDEILELSQNKKFHHLLGIRQKEKSKIYREMRDAELVLRYFAFKDNWMNFTSKMRNNLDLFMLDNQKISKETIDRMSDDFVNTLEIVEACFGEYSFKRWIPEKQQWKKPVLAALFDAQMFACRGLSIEKITPHQDEIISGLKALFSNKDFNQSISAATNTPNFFIKRILVTKKMIENIIGE